MLYSKRLKINAILVTIFLIFLILLGIFFGEIGIFLTSLFLLVVPPAAIISFPSKYLIGIDNFKMIFTLDPRPSKQKLGLEDKSAQYIVSTIIEERRQRAQEWFKKQRSYQLSSKQVNEESLEDTRKVARFAKGDFWYAVNLAAKWGYSVPSSINNPAPFI